MRRELNIKSDPKVFLPLFKGKYASNQQRNLSGEDMHLGSFLSSREDFNPKSQTSNKNSSRLGSSNFLRVPATQANTPKLSPYLTYDKVFLGSDGKAHSKIINRSSRELISEIGGLCPIIKVQPSPPGSQIQTKRINFKEVVPKSQEQVSTENFDLNNQLTSKDSRAFYSTGLSFSQKNSPRGDRRGEMEKRKRILAKLEQHKELLQRQKS
mmetsp:Transcript_17887/g.17099  ORF Transcript_17887/g.17099 Transcript_17887/m.17099 type:complete len:211 (+) Transcript_17887:831-1463(+)